MKKNLFIFAFIIVATILVFLVGQNRDTLKEPPTTIVPSGLSGATPLYNRRTKSLFVPSWTLEGDLIHISEFNELIYFGLAANEDGIDTGDGYASLEKFTNLIQKSIGKSLALRMTDGKSNFKILENSSVQKRIIEQVIDLAKAYKFKGILLDLEVSSLPFPSVVAQINAFVEQFYKDAKKSGLSFSITLFGDTFSKVRPYDVVFLSRNADSIYIMAYDFHKAGGNPGPNFPLKGKETYGYDFETMISDFLNIIPKEKIVVVFGMFGYDWVVDENNGAIENAKALSLNEIKNTFINTCQFRNCSIARDSESYETKISYIDADKKNHIVWFEDEESISKKREFLDKKGIKNISYWAYSFF